MSALAQVLIWHRLGGKPLNVSVLAKSFDAKVASPGHNELTNRTRSNRDLSWENIMNNGTGPKTTLIDYTWGIAIFINKFALL